MYMDLQGRIMGPSDNPAFGVRCENLIRDYILIQFVYHIKGILLAKYFVSYVIAIRQRAR